MALWGGVGKASVGWWLFWVVASSASPGNMGSPRAAAIYAGDGAMLRFQRCGGRLMQADAGYRVCCSASANDHELVLFLRGGERSKSQDAANQAACEEQEAPDKPEPERDGPHDDGKAELRMQGETTLVECLAGDSGTPVVAADGGQGGEISGQNQTSSGSHEPGRAKLPRRTPKKSYSQRRRCCTHADGCTKLATFGDSVQRVPVRCKKHKEHSHIDVSNPTCHQCTKRATFGDPRGRPIACGEHRGEAAVDLRSRFCAHWDGTCRRIAFFGEAGGPTGLGRFCKRHKMEHHVDVRSRKCLHDGCRTQPSFGDKSEGRPIYCKRHMLPGHAMVRGRRCRAPGCGLQPSFGNSDDGVSSFCGAHRQWGHVDLRHRNFFGKDGIDREK